MIRFFSDSCAVFFLFASQTGILSLVALVGTGRMLAGSTAFNLTRSGNSAVHGLEVLKIDRA